MQQQNSKLLSAVAINKQHWLEFIITGNANLQMLTLQGG